MIQQPPLSTKPSEEPCKPSRSKDKDTNNVPVEQVRYFTMAPKEWRKFYNHEKCTLHDDYVKLLTPYLVQLGITCTPMVDYRHERKKESRKQNCRVFGIQGHCKRELCPIALEVKVEEEPRNKHAPCIFTVKTIGVENHDAKQETASRPVTGAARAAMGMLTNFSI
jgi:hypothetical protein